MSGLYIKLFTDFYSHRKTARLRARVGDDAFWIPPRLWAYAAEHQIDGDFSGYSSEELAMLMGCDKHASSILEALLAAGFLDADGKIHDWADHNGFHSTFSNRAKKAADARWKKEKKQKKEDYKEDREGDRDKHCSKHATSMLQASDEANWHLAHGVDLPESLRTPECIEAARLWLTHKKEKRSDYKPTGLKAAATKWAKEFTPEEFIEAVESSIAQNYQGLFPPKTANQGPNGYHRPLIGTNTPADAAF
jgi:hypothetical protein